jgi:hypothetical protein
MTMVETQRPHLEGDRLVEKRPDTRPCLAPGLLQYEADKRDWTTSQHITVL